MKHNCWYTLDIDISNALRKDWEWNIPESSTLDVKIENTRIFNQDWLDYMQSIGIPVVRAMLFYRNSMCIQKNAHVDLRGPDSNGNISYINYAMNWVLGGKDSEMIWYNLPDKNIDVKYSMANTPYIQWPISTLEEIERVNIQNSLTLIRTDIPHSIQVQSEPRWCISARSDISGYSWQQAVDHFRSKNLLIERYI
jgi:hypothetical protein